MAIVVYCLAVLVIAAACQAGPFRPVGYYTFDGKSLRPLNVVQRRSDDDGFSFGGRNGWKLPFSKPGFLSALTDRDSEDDRPTVSAHQLLPDYLTHQEFLKPQLQAAGFSGGRIIAGPFPVPLARLPKPPARSSSVSPTPIPPVEPVTTTTTISKIKPPQQVQSSLPTFIYKATPQPPSYKPVQFPAVQVAPTKVVQAARPSHSPPPPPQQQQQQSTSSQQPKLVYTIPTSNPVHWHAAHQSGPERQASTLGVPSYSHPAALVSESAGGSTRVSYGGWTPIYSASYAHVQTQQDPIPIGKPIQLEQSSDVREINRQPIVVESVVVPERQVVNQPEAQQSLDDGGGEVYEPTIDLVPRVIIPGSPVSSDLTSAIPEKAASVAVPVVVVVASSSSSDDDKSGVDLSASPSLSVPVVTETKRTVRKRKAKQVSSSSIRRNSDRAINQEVAVVTASSSPSAAPSSSSSLPESLPALLSVREGRGQGRYIGRVLPASVHGEEHISDSSVPVGWRQIARR